MADEKPKISIKVSASVTYNKVIERTGLPDFCVDWQGTDVDLRPLAAEVLTDYPEPVPISVEDLARLGVKTRDGRRLRSAEYPPDIDRSVVDELTVRLSRWLFWQNYTQGALAKSQWPSRKFACGDDHCPKALALHTKMVPNEQVERLPFKGCWGHRCTCDWRPVKKDGTVL